MKKFNKVVAGLALVNEIYNRGFNQALFNLYSRPDIDRIRALHDRFIASDDHFDREVAFWLELALEQIPIKIDLTNLVVTMKEMEVLLFDLLWRVNAGSQRDLNDWLNFVANAAQSIQDGYWIDAKILTSQALESSRKESVEDVKRDPVLRRKIEVLQRGTLRCFEQVRRFPLRLRLPEERLDVIIEVQEILIQLVMRLYLERPEKEAVGLLTDPARKLNAALRYMMQSDEMEKAGDEIGLALQYLESRMNNVSNKKTLKWAIKIRDRIRTLSAQLPKSDSE